MKRTNTGGQAESAFPLHSLHCKEAQERAKKVGSVCKHGKSCGVRHWPFQEVIAAAVESFSLEGRRFKRLKKHLLKNSL
ncbi:MAG TPA: hypothetical protein VFS12_10970, partial [Terriglobia bacterium]|nr:hypothetical protein [Terriglobia bacterium]